MLLADVLRFLREHQHVVEASVHDSGAAQAAVIGVAAEIRASEFSMTPPAITEVAIR